jgi:hypothetical protein
MARLFCEPHGRYREAAVESGQVQRGVNIPKLVASDFRESHAATIARAASSQIAKIRSR